MKRRFFTFGWTVVLALSLCVTVFARRMLIPVGKVVGLSLAEGSVTVAAFEDGIGNAAREAGFQIGDEILRVDGQVIDSAADLHRALERSGGSVEVEILRKGEVHTLRLAPAATADGPKLGVFVREGVTGIGTVTFFDPEEGCFGALGHGVSDSRGRLCDMRCGNVYPATVAGVKPGIPGQPGQLKGAVSGQEPVAVLDGNTSFGVFGHGLCYRGEALPAAEAGEVKIGPARILSNISGSETELFEVEIVKVYGPENATGRDMLIRVTDPALLEKTGGIVAGMSGSPIIQNGKLVGAVTHVLVNDPQTGYGIFIENMLEAAS